MSTFKSLDKSFFVSGTEGGILLAICIAAAVCTLVVIALAVTAVLSLKRRKREEEREDPKPVEEGQTTEEAAGQTTEEAAGQAQTKVSAEIFAQGGTLYNKSFTAKLIQSGDEVKSRYAALKNELMSYKKVKARMSWKRESFRIGRKIAARFGYRGNTLCVYLPLDSALYAGSKYKVEDVSGYNAYADTPCMYRLKNERRARYAAELVSAVMGAWGTERAERAAEDYYQPYETTEALIEKGLIKVVAVKSGVQVAEEEVAAENIYGENFEEVAAAEVFGEQPVADIEAAAVEVPEEETKEEVFEETEETVEEAEEQPAEEDEASEEVVECAPSEKAVEVAEVEELSAKEIDDVQSYEEETNDEDGVEVVGVMFRRRGRKVYWFDPDGKTWAKGEIALYESPENSPQEVIVVDNAKISPSKLHLPLKPLRKAN